AAQTLPAAVGQRRSALGVRDDRAYARRRLRPEPAQHQSDAPREELGARRRKVVLHRIPRRGVLGCPGPSTGGADDVSDRSGKPRHQSTSADDTDPGSSHPRRPWALQVFGLRSFGGRAPGRARQRIRLRSAAAGSGPAYPLHALAGRGGPLDGDRGRLRRKTHLLRSAAFGAPVGSKLHRRLRDRHPRGAALDLECRLEARPRRAAAQRIFDRQGVRGGSGEPSRGPGGADLRRAGHLRRYAARPLLSRGEALSHLRWSQRSASRVDRAARVSKVGPIVSESVRAALQERLQARFGTPARIERLALVAGGASMEAWALDVQTPDGPVALLLRRSAGGRIYREALPLEHEHRMLEAAWRAGVLVPRPYGYLADVAGKA